MCVCVYSVCLCVCICVCLCVYMCACVYVCMYVNIYIYVIGFLSLLSLHLPESKDMLRLISWLCSMFCLPMFFLTC